MALSITPGESPVRALLTGMARRTSNVGFVYALTSISLRLRKAPMTALALSTAMELSGLDSLDAIHTCITSAP